MDLEGIYFSIDDGLKDVERKWIQKNPAEFFIDRMRKLFQLWEKFMAVNGVVLKNKSKPFVVDLI